jgi:hypothetical protein
MKLFRQAGFLCAGVSMLAFPASGHCRTKAYSPPIQGQPLIFHKSKPTLSPYENEMCTRLSNKQKINLSLLTELSVDLSDQLLGLSEAWYLPITQDQQDTLVSDYNEQIEDTIHKIYKIFRTLKGDSSKELAKVIRNTLTSFASITNQMLFDLTEGANPNELFQQDYLRFQHEVINYYKDSLHHILSHAERKTILKAESEGALEGLVSTFSLYVLDLDTVVDQGGDVPGNMILARNQVFKNLQIFLDSIYVLQAISNKKCG